MMALQVGRSSPRVFSNTLNLFMYYPDYLVNESFPWLPGMA
jgi:hypothetical protein